MLTQKRTRHRRKRTQLTQHRVERNTKEPGKYACGLIRGLNLQVSESGAKSWLLIYELNGRRHEMGLGSVRDFKLHEARERARLARQLLADGRDPLAEKRAAKAAAAAAQARKLTFAEAAQRWLDQNESQWRNQKHRESFLGTLRTYAFPAIGNIDVAAIEIPDVLRVLEPIWKTTTITADRVRSRIERVLDYAMVRGHRPPGINPAKWPGVLDQVLPPPRKVAPIAHHAAMDYRQVPAFMARLRQEQGPAARVLEFLILTSARTSEVTGATWDEIDLDGKVWIVPAHRMKGGREHRVPLADAAVDLLRKLPREVDNPFVFVGRRGAGLSREAAPSVMERLGLNGKVTIHGFRSSFRDWAGETTSFAHDICEAALSHVRGDHSVRAYARGDLFLKRRKLMESWAKFCAMPPAKVGGAVVTLRSKQR
jgi:integrase